MLHVTKENMYFLDTFREMKIKIKDKNKSFEVRVHYEAIYDMLYCKVP